jgi:hypothetical protein
LKHCSKTFAVCTFATRPTRGRPRANRFNLEHHCQATVWGDAHTRLVPRTDDWLLDSNNGQALFVTGIGNICTGQPGGVAFLARAVDVVDLQAAYVLGILNYYKHGTTDHVFNLIRRIYGEVPIGLLVAGQSWTDEGIHDEDEAHIACVWY